MLGLFTGAVKHRTGRLREVRRRLQQQRGLADAWLAADQDQRAGHDAAAQHAVELADPGRQPLGDDCVDIRVQLRARGRRKAVSFFATLVRTGRSRRGGALLDQRIPRAALRAATEPLGDCAPHS